MGRATRRHRVIRLAADGTRTEGPDTLAGEEPLEIRLGAEPFVVTMRTPGDDFDHVLGYLFAEQVIASTDDVATLSYRSGVDPDGSRSYNVIEATLTPSAPGPRTAPRNVYTSSSCGVCGTASMDGVAKCSSFSVGADATTITLAQIVAMPELLRSSQGQFRRTGAMHAAGLFSLAGDVPGLLCVREDVGRHNAVDKVVGWALRGGRLPLTGTALQVSGRASYELVQKAHLAGIPILAAVSAPSALAVDLAEEAGMTLIGFSRGGGANVYTRPDRVIRC